MRTVVLHKNFTRNAVDADALNVVALVVVAGIVGAKVWHELQNPHELVAACAADHRSPGWHHPLEVVMSFLSWFRDGFAWFGGMLAGIAVLMWQGHFARFKGPAGSHRRSRRPGARVGAIRMLDLAAPAAAIGYGVGRIGCLLSGDGDYGINTTLPWGVHMAQRMRWCRRLRLTRWCSRRRSTSCCSRWWSSGCSGKLGKKA